MTIQELNALSEERARIELARCCGARHWVDAMAARRPFRSREDLLAAAHATDRILNDDDWREAFTHHPRIGDVDSLRKKFASTASWATSEQAGAAAASEEILRSLSDGNCAYEARFGYIFIVCATGKSAEQMLALLRNRIDNAPDQEIRIAAGEQAKITQLRLEKLVTP